MNQINLCKQRQNKSRILTLASLAVFVSPLVLPLQQAVAVPPVVTKIIDFTGNTGTKPGAKPEAGFIQIADPASGLLALYGTATNGGSSGKGVVYKLTSPGATGDFTNETVLVNFTGANGANPQARVTSVKISATENRLFSTTFAGGTNNVGIYYSLSSLNGYGTLTNLLNFSTANGSNSTARPVQDGLNTDLLYGATTLGGANNLGVIYKYAIASKVYNIVKSFTGIAGTTPGAKPKTRVLLVTDTSVTPNKEYYYGTTSEGGANNKGVVFKYDVATSTYTSAPFTGANGANPDLAGLNPDADNTFLYSTAKLGGANNKGAIYRVPLGTSPGSAPASIQLVASFTGANGANPVSSLTRAGNDFYGVTTAGGANNLGGIYRLRNGAIKLIYSFTGAGTGSTPEATLITVKNANGSDPNPGKITFYGTTSAGGAGGYGTVFKVVVDPNDP